MSHEAVLELLERKITPNEYNEILEIWKKHSISEDERNLEGLISTLTEDCTYEMPQIGKVWKGHSGARQFYIELLTAFPDIHFSLQDIVVGPQGVCMESAVTVTHKAKWLEYPPTNQNLKFKTIVFFPWDPIKKKFRGEKIYIDLIEQLMNRTDKTSAK